MSLVLKDHVKQMGYANTTVSFTLSIDLPSFYGFSKIGDGNTTYYSAKDEAGNREVGIGTWTESSNLLTRNQILSSSNADAAVTFSGVVTVFCTFPAALANAAFGLDVPETINPTISSDFANQEYKLYEVPSGLSSKAFSEVWTFTRGSTGSLNDATGLQRTALANAPRYDYDPVTGENLGLRLEEARTNGFLHPRNFNLSSWTKSACNITGSKWFSNGMFGYKVTEDTSTGGHLLLQSYTYTTGNKYAIKWIVTQPLGRTFRMQLGSVAGAFPTLQGARFDCNTMTATITAGTGTASIRGLGDELFELIFITDTATSTLATNTLLYAELSNSASYTGDGITSYYALLAQVEPAASATSEIPDATIFVSRGSPKYVPDATGALVQVLTDVKAMAYNPANLNADPVALYEVASTNLLANRDTMATETVAVTIGQTYTLSFDGTGSVQLSGANATNVVGLGAGLANQKSFTFVASSTSLTLTVTGSCLRGQLENLPYATSRIPNAMVSGVRAADVTTGVQASRAQENCIRTLGKEFNKYEGSIYVEGIDYSSRDFNKTLVALCKSSDAVNNRLQVFINTSGQIQVFVNQNGVTEAFLTAGSYIAGSKYKVLVSWKANKIFIVSNGVLSTLDTTNSPLTNFDELRLGYLTTSLNRVNSGTYKEVQVTPKALSEAEAIALTS